MEAEAYLNRFIRIAEEFMEDVIQPIQPHPELVYIYTQLDYQPTEGSQQPVGEMILQVRMHLSDEISVQQAPGIVATIQGKLGIAASLYSAAWMVQGSALRRWGGMHVVVIRHTVYFTGNRVSPDQSRKVLYATSQIRSIGQTCWMYFLWKCYKR